MTEACGYCGSKSDLRNCKKCKAVTYCSFDCQKCDWKKHKHQCKLQETAGAPCDGCHNSEEFVFHSCVECGFLLCHSCHDHTIDRDDTGRIIDVAPCPKCNKIMYGYESVAEDIVKLHKLINEKADDRRRNQWLLQLARWYLLLETEDGDQKAIKYFKKAGIFGLDEGYSRLADFYIEKQNWEEAKIYYQKAADLHQVVGIFMMGIEALNGFIHPQQDEKRDPDYIEAFRWFQAGAQIGFAPCCTYLGMCYFDGKGTVRNADKGFKWTKRAAEKGDVKGMRRCGAAYLNPDSVDGVEMSIVQAIYWFEKSLELDDDERVRSALQELYSHTDS